MDSRRRGVAAAVDAAVGALRGPVRGALAGAAAAAPPGALRPARGLRRELVALLLHPVVLDGLGSHRQEGARTHVEGDRAPLDPGLESRLLARLGRRRFAPRFPWDLLLLALLLAWLAWDIMRMIRLIFA